MYQSGDNPHMVELDMPKAVPRDADRRSWLGRWARRLGWVVVALLVLGLATWLAVPPLLQWQGQKIGSEKLGRPVHIGAVQFAPWSLALTLHDVSVGGVQPADAPQFAVKRVYANFSLQSLLRLAPVVNALEVNEPALRLRHLGDGRYDVDDVMARLSSGPEPPPDEQPARFALYDIVVQGGRISFIDEPVQRTHEVRDLRLALPFISSLPSQRQTHVTPQLAFSVDGSRFDSDAQTLPFDDSRRTEAHLRLARFDLAPYLVYQPAGLPLRMAAGALQADLRLTFEETPKPSLKVSGTASLSGVQVNDAAGQPALAFERLTFEVGDTRPLERAVHLSRVELTAPRVLVSRDARGQINWVPAAGAPTTAAASKPAAGSAARASRAPAEDWRVRVDRVAVAQGDVQWRDAVPAPGVAAAQAGPAALHLAPLTLEARNLIWPFTQPATFSGRMALADVTAPALTDQQPAAPKARGKSKPAPAKPAPKQAVATNTANAVEAPFVAFEGQARMSAAQFSMQARGLPLRLAQPYLAAFLKPKLAGSVDADAELTWSVPEERGSEKNSDAGASGLNLRVGQLALRQLALLGDTPEPRRGRPRADDLPPGTLAGIDAVTLEGGKLDLSGRSVSVDAVTVQAPRLRIARSGEGRWMFEDWLVKSNADGSSQASEDAPPWAMRVGRVAVAGGAIGWSDRPPATAAVDVALSQLKLDARDFELSGRKPMPLELSALLVPQRGEPGKLNWRGTVGWSPISAQGDVNAERLPLQAFEPYVADQLNIRILRADTSFKGKLDYTQQSQGPRLRVAGDARIEELRTTSAPGSAAANDAAADAAGAAAAPQDSNAALAPKAGTPAGGLGEELLSWKQLRVAGLRVQIDPGQPPQMAVKDSQLSDFYARIIVHPNGRINLQDLVKTAAASDQPADPAAAAPATARMDFGPTRLLHGRVSFSDHFIRPNYSADLTELDGLLGAFSSVADPQAPQMADLQLAGRAQGTAQLAISGKLNPLAQPLALDIAAKLTDLELSPLSPYAVKYSGHGIERGKLSMDVAYKIAPDGQLSASNKLVLNQLQFGEPVPGAPASLPVTLATALLADGNGVINLDLPIGGSLNDPEFSLGPIIFKAIINLIGKALTAPFSLLAHVFGGNGDSDMSRVPFASGSAALSDTAKAQLDQIAKAMTSRPQIKLTVTGSARLEEERAGFQRQRLQALVAAERRAAAPDAPTPPASAASGAASAPAADASAPALVADDEAAGYPELLRRLYRRADIPGKPRNLIGMTKNVPVAQMESQLLVHISVGEDDIRQLAIQRAMAVKDYLLAHQLSADRVFVGAAQTQAPAEPAASAADTAASAGWTPQAELALSAR
jgi:uncharacterized protein involved in outer membrane biogenesis